VPVKTVIQFLLLTVLTVALPAGIAAGQTMQSLTVDSLSWLSGSWVRAENGRQLEEHWMTPAGGVMLGMGRTVRTGKPVAYEYLRIGPADDSPGAPLVYWALPSGQAPARFTLSDSGDSHVTFINPGHDFPRRIHYARSGDRLTAEIAGPGSDGREKTIRWVWDRAPSLTATGLPVP
jgi:hypothetical protein